MHTRVEDKIIDNDNIDGESDLFGLFSEDNNSTDSESTHDPSSEEENDFGLLFDDALEGKDPSEVSVSSNEDTSSESEQSDSIPIITTHTKSHFLNGNGLLSCYNLVPGAFSSLAEMTAYLEQIKEMGFNTVWINPIQEATSAGGKRTDKINMQRYSFAYSLYGMKSDDIFDQRISTVKRDNYENYIFTNEQIKHLMSLNKQQLKDLFDINSEAELKHVLRNENNHDVVNLKKKYENEEKLLKTDIAKLSDRIKTLNLEKDAAIKIKIKLDSTINNFNADASGFDNSGNINVLQQQLQTIISNLGKLNKELRLLNEDLQFKQKKLKNDNLNFLEKFKQMQKQIVLAQYFDKQAIIEFTNRAKSLGITPIFDLVLNHVGLGSTLIAKYPHWFGVDESFKDVASFRYKNTTGEDNSALIEEIVETFWKPFIKKYIVEYGFEGARVDCVRKLPLKLRTKIYDYITELMESLNKPYPPVFLEELLFSENKPLEQVIQQVGNAGGTHITGSMFYKRREWHGGIPSDIRAEAGLKGSIVSKGVINFTGNHDHTPAAREILLEMAYLRKDKDNSLLRKKFKQFEEQINAKRDKDVKLFRDRQAKGELTRNVDGFLDNLNEKYDAKIKFYQQLEACIIADEIKQEIIAAPNSEIADDFLKRIRDKITVNMFAGSAGFYLLCGDEAANTIPAEIFLRENGSEAYPQRMHKLLVNPSKEVINCLEQMAIKNLEGKSKVAYEELNGYTREQTRILSPLIDEIINKINAGDQQIQNQFKENLNQYGINFIENDYIARPRNSENLWQIIDKKFNLQSFIKEQNEILSHLPEPTKGTWAHSFILERDFIITIRVNDLGYSAPAHLILTNLNPNKPIEFGIKELKKVAIYFQQRCYPPKECTDYYEQYKDDPGFSAAWHLIMSGAKDTKPIIYCNSGIEIDSSLKSMAKIGFQPENNDNNKIKDIFLQMDTGELEELLNGPMLTDFLPHSSLNKTNAIESDNNSTRQDKGKQKDNSNLKSKFDKFSKMLFGAKSDGSFSSGNNANANENKIPLRTFNHRK